MKILQLGFLLLSIAASLSSAAFGFGNNDRVLLKDISTLTLYHGKMTNGRRSSPVPQLKCVGGTASGSFVPQVVQCYNRGTDGYDVQWECKTDMDNAYRFGKVEVTCEGFDYPDDPYVLKGSCGLEYTLDLTKEGYQQKQHGGHDYYGNQGYQHHHNSYDYGSNSYKNSYSKKAGSVVGDLIFLGVIAVIIYAIYKTCINSNRAYTNTDDYDHRNRFGGERRQPPPPGFRDEYTQGDSCSSTYNGSHTNTGTNTNTGGGGFWTGAFTGGLLGYMFGNRNSYGSRTYHSPYNSWGNRWNNGWGSWGTGWGNSWGGGGNTFATPRYSSGSAFSGSSSHSSGTRTASGFGGTKRR